MLLIPYNAFYPHSVISFIFVGLEYALRPHCKTHGHRIVQSWANLVLWSRICVGRDLDDINQPSSSNVSVRAYSFLYWAALLFWDTNRGSSSYSAVATIPSWIDRKYWIKHLWTTKKARNSISAPRRNFAQLYTIKTIKTTMLTLNHLQMPDIATVPSPDTTSFNRTRREKEVYFKATY
jgi:hypothetical protein